MKCFLIGGDWVILFFVCLFVFMMVTETGTNFVCTEILRQHIVLKFCTQQLAHYEWFRSFPSIINKEFSAIFFLVQDNVPTDFDFEYCNDPGACWRPTNDCFIVIALKKKKKNTGESKHKNKHYIHSIKKWFTVGEYTRVIENFWAYSEQEVENGPCHHEHV